MPDPEWIEVEDYDAAIELFFAEGWSDGLPVVPPTERRVQAMFEGLAGLVDLQPEAVVGTVPARRRAITAEKVAVNAVMAGCKPEYFPVVLAAVQAVCDPRFSVHGPTATTAGTGILVIVNGPIQKVLGINSGANLFGPGHRANATIGRAVRLTLRNAAGANVDELDRACLSHPGKYTYCIGEEEDALPWSPLHVQRGFDADDSTVTVFAAQAPNQIQNDVSPDGRGILATLADRMAAFGTPNLGVDGECVVVVADQHRKILVRDGLGKAEIQQYLFHNARRTVAEQKRAGLRLGPAVPEDEELEIAVGTAPEHILVVAAGGVAGGWSCFIPGWGDRGSSQAVTTGIPGYAKPEVCELW